MKIVQISILALLVVLFAACDTNYGDSVIRDRVQVYYLKPVNQTDAERLADYWEQKQLVSNRVQYLQLSELDGITQLKLIPNDSTFLQEIPFEIQLELAKLDSMLSHDLFQGKNFELLVSDKTFTKSKRIF